MLNQEKHELYCDLKVLIEKYWVLKEQKEYSDFIKELAAVLGI